MNREEILEAVKGLKKGDSIVIKNKSGEYFKGQLIEVALMSEGIAYGSGFENHRINFRDIKRIGKLDITTTGYILSEEAKAFRIISTPLIVETKRVIENINYTYAGKDVKVTLKDEKENIIKARVKEIILTDIKLEDDIKDLKITPVYRVFFDDSSNVSSSEIEKIEII